ncbi:sensor domain-containing diguanylate cyclase [Sulfurimonas sp.]|uniref:sensor domain-containing diguanylate cyclase n=1 Tax=Sulfurimonas sp. TaxID=2022749 RepID=UPI002AAF3B70|nr:sensor domain-containing diguanylate cyclase [Sulfurimonas sp.]
MKSKYKIIYIIAFLLLFLSISLSVVNYVVSLKSTQDQLENSSLPLSTDNIYSEIQTHLIKPTLIASMMAQDTFVIDWLKSQEEDEEKIKSFLESIKNKYNMSTVFLASQSTQNYYLSRGFIEKMNRKNRTNNWYYEFKDEAASYEVNIDFNENINNSMFMFINYKIFDKKFHMLGVTGVGLEVSYIDEMLKKFREFYKFKVFFVNKNGDIILYERGVNELRNLKNDESLYQHKDELLTSENNTLKYKDKKGSDYLIHSKYIPELNLYLFVQAKISDFTGDVLKTFYINLVLSLIIAVIIVYIIATMIRSHSIKLENLANIDELTNLPNRRVFDDKMTQLLLVNERKPISMSILFFDIDDFKKINDTFGHHIGDKVLVRIAQILRENVRESDIYARWGGEEFIVTFINSSLDQSETIAQKLRTSIEMDEDLSLLLDSCVTASFGLTQVEEKDSLESILKRVDTLLYKAKKEGKNRVLLV